LTIQISETFAPLARMNTIKTLLSLAAQFRWQVHQMDVKCTFLQGDLTEEVYMEKPLGYTEKGKELLMCHLKHR
jgi:hypothetical protein